MEDNRGTSNNHILSIQNLADFQHFCRNTAGHRGPQYYLRSQVFKGCQIAKKMSLFGRSCACCHQLLSHNIVNQWQAHFLGLLVTDYCRGCMNYSMTAGEKSMRIKKVRVGNPLPGIEKSSCCKTENKLPQFYNCGLLRDQYVQYNLLSAQLFIFSGTKYCQVVLNQIRNLQFSRHLWQYKSRTIDCSAKNSLTTTDTSSFTVCMIWNS